MDVGNRGRRFGTLGEGFPRGLEREMRGPGVVGIWRGIAYSEYARWCIVSSGWRSAAQCADTTPKGIGQ